MSTQNCQIKYPPLATIYLEGMGEGRGSFYFYTGDFPWKGRGYLPQNSYKPSRDLYNIYSSACSEQDPLLLIDTHTDTQNTDTGILLLLFKQ